VVISAAVEGLVDEAVARRLIALVGATPGPVYGKSGKAYLRQRIAGYNNAARHSPWLVLVDLDSDAACAPPLLAAWLPMPAPYISFRVAVRETEAWLLADAQHLAAFLRIACSRIPRDPESLDNPKNTLVELARHSRSRSVREDMVPRPASGRPVGPAYVSRLIEFVSGPSALWRPETAARRSDSLNRCLIGLRRLARFTSI